MDMFLLRVVIVFSVCGSLGAQHNPRQAPTISVSAVGSAASDVRVSENAPPGTLVAIVTVDKANQDVWCSTRPPAIDNVVELQQVNPGTYKLVTTTTFDREVVSSITVQISCVDDHDDPPLLSRTSVTMRVLDQNDNIPIFSMPVYNVEVNASAPVGSVVGSVRAMDRDSGDNALLRYSLRSPLGEADAPLALAVDAWTGQLTTTRSLELEAGNSREFLATARDSGSPSHTGTATVIMTIS